MDIEKRFTDAKTILEQNGATLTQKTYVMNQAGWAVDLSGKEIKPETLDGISRLIGLCELNLKGSKITDEQMALIGKVVPLYILDISDTGITDAGLAQLTQNTIAQLSVTGSKVTPDGIATLEKRYSSDPAVHPFFKNIKVKR